MKSKVVKSVRWDITNKCNLKCLHCYTLDNPGTDIQYPKVLQIIQRLLTLGLEEINFSGREPTLRSDLAEIIKWCCAKNIRVNVTTNGTVLDRNGFNALLHTGLNMLVFSLDGISNMTHDKIRGEGNFYKTIQNILFCLNYIRKNNLSTKIGISCTLQKINEKEIPGIIDLCNFFGIQFLSINPVSFCGSATKSEEILYLSPQEIMSCWFRICDVYKQIKPSYGFFLGTFPMESKLLNAKYDLELPVIHTVCTAGTTLYIDSHGRALPCYMLPSMADEIFMLKEYLCYWDILNEPIDHAFDTFQPFISYAHAMSKSDYIGCADCPDVEICKGCPLITLSEPESIQRCQLAYRKLSTIHLNFSKTTKPSIKNKVSWKLNDDILSLSLASGDYSSDKEFKLDHFGKTVWAKLNGQSSVRTIEKKLGKDLPGLPMKRIKENLHSFIEYFWKEGVLGLEITNE